MTPESTGSGARCSAPSRARAAAAALLPRAQRQGLRAGVVLCQGAIFETAGDNTQAMAQYQQAVAIATQTHDDDMLAESLFSRGYLLGVQGDYASGLIDLRRAEGLFERLAKPLHALTTLNSIAILYNRMSDYAQARHIYTRALKAQRAAGLQREAAVTLHNLGRAAENLHDWEAARQAVDMTHWFPERGHITASFGVAVSVPGKDTPGSMLKRADSALYVAKRSGRNCVKTEPAAQDVNPLVVDG